MPILAPRLRCLVVSALLFSSSASRGQTTINIPPGPTPTVARDGEIVNVFEEGWLSSNFDALDGSEVNLLGGILGRRFEARNGSLVNIERGRVEEDFIVFEGAEVNVSGATLDGMTVSRSGVLNVSGGAFGELHAQSGASVTLAGFGFKVGGVPIAGLDAVGNQLPYNVPVAEHLSGIFADGTPFVLDGDRIASGTLTLSRSDALPDDPKTILIPGDQPPLGLRNGQRLIINDETFRLQNNFIAGEGSSLELQRGQIGSQLRSIGAEVTIRDGEVGGDFQTFHGSTTNIEGGVIGRIMRAFDNSVINISGGRVFELRLHDQSELHVSGGQVDDFGASGIAAVRISGGEFGRSIGLNQVADAEITGGNFGRSFSIQSSTATISGGAFGDGFRFYDGSTTKFQGFDFHINNVPVAGLENVGDAKNIWLRKNDFFTGVLADGTPFAFTLLEEDEVYVERFRVEQTAEPTNAPTLINVPGDEPPLGIRRGQTLVLDEGGALAQNFGAGRGSVLRVEGGSVGENLEAVDADVIVNGGTVGRLVGLFGESSLTINGGDIASVASHHNSIVSVNGGLLSGEAWEGTRWNQTGGVIGNLELTSAHFTMTGGSTLNKIDAWSGSTVEITGGETVGVGIGEDSTVVVDGGNHAGFSMTSGGAGRINAGRHHQVSVRSDSSAELHGGNLGVATNNAGGSNTSTPSIGVTRGHLKIFGGALGDELHNNLGVVEFYGADFQVEGQPVAGLNQPGDMVEVSLAGDGLFSGVLSDGTPFAYQGPDRGRHVLGDGTYRLIFMPPAPPVDAVVTVNSGQGPLGARSGQTVILEDGGFLDDNFVAADGSTVVIRGGEVYQNLESAGGLITIEGGQIGKRLSVLSGGVVTITGGNVDEDPEVFPGGVLHLEGGQLDSGGAARGGTFNLKSGIVKSDFDVTDGGVANISGGVMLSGLDVFENSSANITGGHLNSGFSARSGAQVTMSGGVAEVNAEAGSQVVVTGGIVDGGSNVRADGNADISGGGLGDDFVNSSAGGLILRGQHFEIDGTPVAGLTQAGDELVVTVNDDQLFTGTLADGSPFVFSRDEGDRAGMVRLIRSADLPPGPVEIHVSNGQGPGGAYAGQRVTLAEGGTLPINFNAGRDSVVNVLGGEVLENFEAYAAVVNVQGGSLSDAAAFAESEINISGGAVDFLYALDGADLNVTGGVINSIQTRDAAVVNLSGGQVASLRAGHGARTVWTGGAVASVDVSGNEGLFEVHGVDFQVNGVAVAGLGVEGSSLQVDIGSGEILTGVLADGTPMVLGSFDPRRGSGIDNGAMTLVRSAAPPALEPSVVEVDSDVAPFAVGLGQTLHLLEGGQLPMNFIAGGGSRVEMQGGVILPGFRSFDSQVVIRDGEVGASFMALRDTQLLVTGGQIDAGLHLFAGAQAAIRGGLVTDAVLIDEGAVVDLFGTSFLLSGQPLPGLNDPGDVVTISQRGFELLSAVLEDGSELNWVLAPSTSRDRPYAIDPGATLRLHLVPEPATILFALAALGILPRVRCRK